MQENGFRWKLEYLRVMTPVFLFSLNLLAGMMLSNQSQLINKIDVMDGKIFVHLTNEEIHTPRQFVVSKEEFSLYQKMREGQMEELKRCEQDIKASILRMEERLFKQ